MANVGNEFGLDPGEVEQNVSDFKNQIAQLSQLNDLLKAHTSDISLHWLGEDADSFKNAQNKISKSIEEFSVEAEDFKAKIQNKYDRYMDAIAKRKRTTDQFGR